MTTRTEPPRAKSIHIYKNGDNYYAGRKFVVNQKQIRTFDAFKTQVTSGIRASNAVRNIYTPVNGHVVGNLDTLENGSAYVAGGVEKFKKIGYRDIGAKKPTNRQRTLEITPVKHSIYRDKIGARWREWVVQPTSIHLYRNGDEKNPAVRLLLPRKALQSWDMVLDYVTDRINLRTGAVRRLYSLEGRPIVDLKDIQNGEYYVAVGADRKFKKVPYGQDISSPVNSPRSVRTLPPLNNRPRPPPQRLTQTQPSKFNQRRLKEQDSPKAGPNNNKRPRRFPKKSEEKQEVDSVFPSKPTIPKRGSKDKENEEQIKYEDDPNSVFKAKNDREETRGAKEVKEDKDTAVDLPIDQVAAEEVDEEEIQAADDEPEIADNDVKAAESDTKSEPDDQWNRRDSPERFPSPSQMSTKTKTPPPKTPSPEPKSPTPAPKTPTPEPKSPTPAPKTPTPEPESPTPAPKTPTPEPESPTPAPKSPTPSEKSLTTNGRPKTAPVSSATSSKHSIAKESSPVITPPKSPERSPSPPKVEDDDDIKEDIEEEKPANDDDVETVATRDGDEGKPADDAEDTKVADI